MLPREALALANQRHDNEHGVYHGSLLDRADDDEAAKKFAENALKNVMR